MKLSCTKENLEAGLSVVSRVAGRNLTLPILGNVLLKAEQGVVFLSATNLEIGVVARVRGKVAEPGSVTVQARLFSEFIGLLEHERIELESDAKTLKIVGEASSTTIRGMPAEEFPIIPSVPRELGFRVGADDFRGALNQVLFAAAQDASRPEISGAFLQIQKNQLTLAATDSYRLAEKTISLESGQVERSTIVPSRALYELARILPGEGDVEVYLSEGQTLFVTDAVELTTRLIEGQYPDYKQIIPKSSTTEATVDVGPFTKLVKTASLFCKPGINDVTIDFSPEEKTVSCTAANTELGEHHGSIRGQIEGTKNSIVFNFRYLLEGLANLGTASVVLGVTDNSSPGILRPKAQERGQYLYLIMPIRQ